MASAATIIGTYYISNLSVSGVALWAIGLYGTIESVKKMKEHGFKKTDSKEYLKGAIHIASLIFGLTYAWKFQNEVSQLQNKNAQLQNENAQLQNQLKLIDKQLNLNSLLEVSNIPGLGESTRSELFRLNRLTKHFDNDVSVCDIYDQDYSASCKSKNFAQLNTEKLQELYKTTCSDNSNPYHEPSIKKMTCSIFNSVIEKMNKEIETVKAKHPTLAKA